MSNYSISYDGKPSPDTRSGVLQFTYETPNVVDATRCPEIQQIRKDEIVRYLQETESKRRTQLVRQRKRENAQFRKAPLPTTEQGKLWKEYNDLFRKLRQEDEDNHTETAHITQDEIYCKFIIDMVGGRFRTQEEIRAMALWMKLNVVDFDVPGHWWYA